MNMKVFAGVLMCCIGVAAHADTGADRGHALLGECAKAVHYLDNPNAEPNAVDMIHANRCTFYVSGARDAFTLSKKYACVPASVSAGELAHLVVAHGRERPDILAQHKLALAFSTMMASYPCDEDQ